MDRSIGIAGLFLLCIMVLLVVLIVMFGQLAWQVGCIFFGLLSPGGLP